MKILITGGQGFMGQYLIEYFEKFSKHKIFATYRKIKNKKKSSVTWIKIQNLKSNNIYKFDYDVVIDLAWYDLNNYRASSHLKKQVLEHLFFFRKLLKKNKKINIFGFGTCLEYGLREGKLSENMKPSPQVNYAKGKDSLRKKIMFLRKKYNYSINWLRLFYIYGEKQEKKKIFTQFIHAVKSKKKFFFMSKGTQERDYIHINTVVKIIAFLVNKNINGGIINICSGNAIKVINLVKTWKKKFKSKIILKTNKLEVPTYEPQIFYGCIKKLNKIMTQQ